MKTKAENLRLFKEARSLRESVRSGLHKKATNAPENIFNTAQSMKLNVHNKANQCGPKKG